MHTKSLFALTIALIVLAAAPGLAQDKAAGAQKVKIEVTKDLAMQDFLDTVAAATGKPLIYDPKGQRIRGRTMGVAFKMMVPKKDLFDTYRSILAFYELTLIPVGPKEYQVQLVVDSRSTNNLVKNKALFVDRNELAGYADKDGAYITTVIPVKHIKNLTALRSSLSTMVSPAGIGRVQAVSGAHAVILMDFAPKVVAMAKVIETMDVEPPELKLVTESIELKYARAEDLAVTIANLMARPAANPAVRRSPYFEPEPPAARVVAYKPRNALAVSATATDLQRIREFVRHLDRPARQWVSAESAVPGQ